METSQSKAEIDYVKGKPGQRGRIIRLRKRNGFVKEKGQEQDPSEGQFWKGKPSEGQLWREKSLEGATLGKLSTKVGGGLRKRGSRSNGSKVQVSYMTKLWVPNCQYSLAPFILEMGKELRRPYSF